MKFQLLSAFILIGFIQCKSVKHASDNSPIRAFQDSLNLLITNDTLLNQHFVGFNLVDLHHNNSVCSKNKDLLFTPASNIKLLTYFTCLAVLPDSITTFRYKIFENKILLAPNADPTFLNQKLDSLQKPFEYLRHKKIPISITINPKNKINHYGEGWAWDDNSYSFQTPLSVMPVYGNNVLFSNKNLSNSIDVMPSLFRTFIEHDSLSSTFIKKSAFENKYMVNKYKQPRRFKIHKPFLHDEALLSKLLSDTLKVDVDISKVDIDTKHWNSYKSVPADSLYKAMLSNSDNFVAEQLLLMCSNEKLGYFNSKHIIAFALDSLLPDTQGKIRWVDASGLSRYNLLSPSYTTEVLQHIYSRESIENILKLFPSAESNGSMPEIFMKEKNWLYAKTGTLSNNFCLSGFLISDNNSIYAFSFMNNHFIAHKNKVVQSVYNILNYIKKEG